MCLENEVPTSRPEDYPHQDGSSVPLGLRVVQVLREHLHADPTLPVSLEEIARESGSNRETVRQYYRQISQRETVPPLKKVRYSSEQIVAFKARIRDQFVQGIKPGQIKRDLGIGRAAAERLVGGVHREILAELSPEFVRVRINEGLGNKAMVLRLREIRPELGEFITLGVVASLSDRLVKRELVPPVRRPRRSTSALEDFYRQVEKMRIEGQTPTRIAQALDVPLIDVNNASKVIARRAREG